MRNVLALEVCSHYLASLLQKNYIHHNDTKNAAIPIQYT